MSARENILKRVRSANAGGSEATPNESLSVAAQEIQGGREALLAMLPESVQHRLSKPQRSTQPEIHGAVTDELIRQMEAVQMSVVRLQSISDVVAAVDWYLQEHEIEGEMTVGPSLNNLDWPENTRFGSATGYETTSVTTALAAIAETGSVALASGQQTPSTLNFLPENHIVVLHESQVVKHTEDVWTQLRSMPGIPRALNLVTGPSRTGDIEQAIELGAHGPRRMHVLLVAGD